LTSDKYYCDLNATDLHQLSGKFLSFFILFSGDKHESGAISDEFTGNRPLQTYCSVTN